MKSILAALLGTCLFAFSAHTQSVSSAPVMPPGAPEEGFVSPGKYTNAFFGFMLPVPQGEQFQDFSPNFAQATRDPSRHTLFGFQSFSHGLSTFLVTSNQSAGSTEDVKRAASGPKGQSARQLLIAGKEFWKSESEEKTKAGKIRSVFYSTSLRGYVVTFSVVGFDLKLGHALEQDVESLTFFDPSKAKEVAGPDSRPYHPRGSEQRVTFSPSKRISSLSLGDIAGNVYSNRELRFTYEFPPDWQVVDKVTSDMVMETGHHAVWDDDRVAQLEHEQSLKCSRLLLYVRKSPVGTTGPSAAVAIMAFDPQCMPGVPSFPRSVDDDEGIRRLGGALMQSIGTGPFKASNRNSVRVLSAGGHPMLEIQGSVSLNRPESAPPVRGFASMVLTSMDDYWIEFTFMGGSDFEVQELVKSAKISIAPALNDRAEH